MITVIPGRPAIAPRLFAKLAPVLAYGLIARTLFGANTPPLAMRARFERFARTSTRKPAAEISGRIRFEDHVLGRLHVEIGVRKCRAAVRDHSSSRWGRSSSVRQRRIAIVRIG